MSVARKGSVFVLVAFAISWTAAAIAWRAGMTSLSDAANRPLIFQIFPFGPAIAAVLCTLAFEKPREWLNALGLGFRPNIWWLFALLFPLALGLISAFANIVIANHDLFLAQSWRDALGAMTDNAMGNNFPNIWIALLVASVIALLTEEPGWRGYLYHLWRDWGFWRYSVVIGVLWALWHLPMIFLFGLGGDDAGLLGFLAYMGGLILLAVYCTLIRDRARSIVPVAIFHGVWNTVSGAGAAWWVVDVVLVIGVGVIAWRRRVEGRAAIAQA
jgi:membrane protease YdiL (CAAX protease family)